MKLTKMTFILLTCKIDNEKISVHFCDSFPNFSIFIVENKARVILKTNTNVKSITSIF